MEDRNSGMAGYITPDHGMFNLRNGNESRQDAGVLLASTHLGASLTLSYHFVTVSKGK